MWDPRLSALRRNIHFGLKSIVLPDVMTKIDHHAFSWYCEKLESVTLPAGLKELGTYAFNDLKMLSNINVAGGTNNVLPDGLTTLGSNIFWNTRLQDITIPSSLTIAGDQALIGMKELRDVYWNSSAAVLYQCFRDCTNLERVWFTSETAPTVGDDIFSGVYQPISISIPAAYEENYSAWKALENNNNGWIISWTTTN